MYICLGLCEGMNMKKIAFIMDAVSRQYLYLRASGILPTIETSAEKINLYMFRGRAAEGRRDEYNMGEYSIYTLPELKDFDGIILNVHGNYSDGRLKGGNIIENIIDNALAANIPIVSMSTKLEGVPFVGIDNHSSMYNMMQHLHKVHSYSKFWFIMGKKDNYENGVREAGIMDYLRDVGLEGQNEFFYNGSYSSFCGEDGFLKLYKKYGKLPEVIVCANDMIALGVCKAAKKKGIRVPEDVCVTGYDNYEFAGYHTPGITTVRQNWHELGVKCMEILKKQWNNEKVHKETYVKTDIIYRGSCGCKEDDILSRMIPAARLYSRVEMDEFDNNIEWLEQDMSVCKTFDDIVEIFLKDVACLGCRGVYLAMNENLNERNAAKFSDRMKLLFAWESGRLVEKNKPINGIFPAFDDGEGRENYLFFPIHFDEYPAGYIVFRGAEYVIRNPHLIRIVGVLSEAIGRCHTMNNIELLSITDAMTGFYNRLGYQQIVQPFYDVCCKEGHNITVLFVDMDRLKFLNDNYGHEMGDLAISSVAKAIKQSVSEGTYVVRMGGDEFLIVLDSTDREYINRLINMIGRAINEMKEVKRLPYVPTVSAGYVITNMSDNFTLDRYVKEADDLMYQIKGEKRRKL